MEEVITVSKKVLVEDLAEEVVLDQIQWANPHLVSRVVEHRPSANRQGQVLARRLDLVSRVEVLRLESHHQVDLEAIKDLNQEEVFR